MNLKCFHGLFSKKKFLKSFSWDQISELSVRKVSSAEQNVFDEISSVRNEVKSGDMSVRKWDWWIELRESGPKIDPTTGVISGWKQTFPSKKHHPGWMAKTPRAGTGDSACRSQRHRCSIVIIRQGTLFMRGHFLVTLLPAHEICAAQPQHSQSAQE
jgi:hypothetical protein